VWGPAPLVVTTAGLSVSCWPERPAYDSPVMFLKPQTNVFLRRFSTASLESDTALRLWLALQQMPSRSPRACSQKMGLCCSWASCLASSSDDCQATVSFSLVTFF